MLSIFFVKFKKSKKNLVHPFKWCYSRSFLIKNPPTPLSLSLDSHRNHSNKNHTKNSILSVTHFCSIVKQPYLHYYCQAPRALQSPQWAYYRYLKLPEPRHSSITRSTKYHPALKRSAVTTTWIHPWTRPTPSLFEHGSDQIWSLDHRAALNIGASNLRNLQERNLQETPSDSFEPELRHGSHRDDHLAAIRATDSPCGCRHWRNPNDSSNWTVQSIPKLFGSVFQHRRPCPTVDCTSLPPCSIEQPSITWNHLELPGHWQTTISPLQITAYQLPHYLQPNLLPSRSERPYFGQPPSLAHYLTNSGPELHPLALILAKKEKSW